MGREDAGIICESGQDCGGFSWNIGSVDCLQDRIHDATLGDACTHGIDRGHRVGLGNSVVSVGQIGLQDEEIGGRKDALELGEEALMPQLIEPLFNIEEGCSTILSKLKGRCHSIHYSMALMENYYEIIFILSTTRKI